VFKPVIWVNPPDGTLVVKLQLNGRVACVLDEL
jgi:hypothetical protein